MVLRIGSDKRPIDRMLPAVPERGCVSHVVEPSCRHRFITVLRELGPLLRRLCRETDVAPSIAARIQQLSSDGFAFSVTPMA